MTKGPAGNAGGQPQTPSAGSSGDRLQELLSASHAITSAPDEKALVKALGDVMSSTDVDIYSLARYVEDDADPTMVVIASWDRQGTAPVPVGARFPRSTYASLDQLSRAKPGTPWIKDESVQGIDLDEAAKQITESLGIKAFSMFPLLHDGQTCGAFSVSYRTARTLTPDEIHFYGILAQLLSIALVSIDARAELARQLSRVNALYRVGEALGSVDEKEALTETAARLLVSNIGYLNCWIGVVDEDARMLREAAFTGVGTYPGREPGNHPLSATHVAAVDALQKPGPFVVEDILPKAEAEGWGDTARVSGMRCLAHAPLRAGGKVVGVLSVGSRSARLPEDELSLLGAFGNQLASTMQRLQMGADREKQIRALEDAYASQARLLETVRELSTPVIPVHDGVLVLPLVGTIDSGRSAQVMESLLNAIQKDRASFVIIDITGVPTVDTGVANHLLRSTRAAALLGARCVLVGVSPAVAQTLVQLGVDLGDLVTRSDLQAGIAYALGALGRGVGREAAKGVA
jgi:anti-anti-sigma factor